MTAADPVTVDPYRNVVGQRSAVEMLRTSAAAPVHAYLLVGPPGSGKRDLALAFAADVLSRSAEGSDPGRIVDLALAERHPDLLVVGADATAVRRPEAERLREAASRSPVEGTRKVLVGVGFDVIGPEAAALLLKSIEEPGDSTVFVLAASDVPPDLVTIASRCVRVDLGPLSTEEITGALLESDPSQDPERVRSAAAAAEGDMGRARLLASDEGFVRRQKAWEAVPGRLDRTGAMVSVLVDELLGLIDEAVAPLEAQHEAEREAQAAEAEEYGLPARAQRETSERQRRQVRRFREGELRVGLALLARIYHRAGVDGALELGEVTRAVGAIDALAAELVRHPNERLQLAALFFELPELRDR